MVEYWRGELNAQRVRSFVQVVEPTQTTVDASLAYLSDDLRAACVEKMRADDWASLPQLVEDEGPKNRRLLEQLATHREQLALSHLPLEWASVGQPLQASADEPAVQRMVDILIGRGVNPDEARRAIARVTDRQASNSTYLASQERLVRRVEELWTLHLRRAAMLNHVLAVARFNTLTSPGQRVAADTQSAETLVARSASFRNGTTKALRDQARRRAFGALGQLCRSALVQTSDLLGKEIIPELAAVWSAREAARGAGVTRRDWSELSVQLSHEARQLLQLLSILRDTEGRILWPVQSVQEELDAAARLTLRSKKKLPTQLSVRTLARQPNSQLDRPVSISGLISSIEITHDGEKAVSHIRVRDVMSESEVAAELHGIKVDSGGMVPGSVATIAGTWRNPQSDEAPALFVGRFALQEASSETWEDWLAWKASPIYQAVPHELLVEWSWEPGFDGAGNPIRYDVYARSQ